MVAMATILLHTSIGQMVAILVLVRIVPALILNNLIVSLQLYTNLPSIYLNVIL